MYGYTKLEQEETDSNTTIKTPVDWPKEGGIIFSDVSMSYRDDGVFALKNTTFHVKGGEKVIQACACR